MEGREALITVRLEAERGNNAPAKKRRRGAKKIIAEDE
jgi:hypothetical protein